MPEPPAMFSPLATTKSIPSDLRRRGKKYRTALRPGFPTMSPMKSSFTGLTLRHRSDPRKAQRLITAKLEEWLAADYEFGVSLKITGTSIHQTQLKTRMPFKYGIATMTEVPMVFVQVETEVDGRPSWGVSSDLLPPKWFTKVPDDPLEQEIADMLRVIHHAMAISKIETPSAFAAWRTIYEQQAAWAKAENIARCWLTLARRWWNAH